MTDRHPVAAVWHGATFLVIAVSIVVQLALVIRGHGVLVETADATPLAERLLRFFSYFTIQSNLLAAAAALSLMARPDHDGHTWRVMRAASVIGMTVTFATYIVVLRPIVHLEGTAKLADIGFHYIAPVLTVVGWLLFGPWPRVDNTTAVRAIAWPFSYLIYVLVLGAISGWYPYPFIDVAKIGYARALLNAFVVTLLLLIVVAIARVLDTRRGGAKAQPLP
ncbi:MAG: Pr6Pr family membrane protein [Gemmatimonadota bacterium]|nr:Pr6Pr family membrane protein [Gemmatimonadota bacterium]